MRLRRLIVATMALSLALGAAALVFTVQAVRDTRDAARDQAQALAVLREARWLIELTHEFARSDNARAVQQWRLHFKAMERELALVRESSAAPQLGDTLSALPRVFDKLVTTRGAAPDDAVAQRRRELLVDNLIADTQSVLQQMHGWAVSLNARRSASEQHLALMAVGGPSVLVLLLVGVMWTLSRRVMRPLRELDLAMAQVEAGNLGARCESRAADELGDIGRAFDRMTKSLQSSRQALADKEVRLRTITDNLPPTIAYIDNELRYRFVNAAGLAALGVADEAAVLGRTVRELRGELAFGKLEPHVLEALRGERTSVQMAAPVRGELRHSACELLPDIDAAGQVRGCYVMVHDVTEYISAQATVEAALREKEVLLKEVHHRVKNNMQVVCSLLELQTGTTEEPAVRAQLETSQDRIRSMALIHEKLYRSTNFAQVDFADCAQSVVHMLAASHAASAAKASVTVNAEPIWIGIEQAIPAGLVLSELVSNSFKHGFPNGHRGHIEVSFTVAGMDRVRLAVSDTGVGPAPGFDQLGTGTLGLNLVHILAEQLGAELSIAHERGFTCSLVFAVPSLRAREAAPEVPTQRERELAPAC